MRIPESTNEASLALGKLEYWTDSVNSIFLDQPMREPVSICIHHAAKENPIPKRMILRLIEARKMEVENKTLENMGQLVQMSEMVRTTMILLNLNLLRID